MLPCSLLAALVVFYTTMWPCDRCLDAKACGAANDECKSFPIHQSHMFPRATAALASPGSLVFFLAWDIKRAGDMEVTKSGMKQH
jgi:hypothetical protein